MFSQNPFAVDIRRSSIWGNKGGKLVNLVNGNPATPIVEHLHALLKGMCHSHYPCIGAPMVFKKNLERLIVYQGKMSQCDITLIAHDVYEYILEYRAGEKGNDLTLMIAFTEVESYNEIDFEKLFWDFAHRLSIEQSKFFSWAKESSPLLDANNFTLSFAEESLFAATFHNASHRTSRKFAYPVIIINPHAQFQKLKDEGVFEKWKKIIRDREIKIDGSINHTLSDYPSKPEGPSYPSSQKPCCPYKNLLESKVLNQNSSKVCPVKKISAWIRKLDLRRALTYLKFLLKRSFKIRHY